MGVHVLSRDCVNQTKISLGISRKIEDLECVNAKLLFNRLKSIPVGVGQKYHNKSATLAVVQNCL